MKTTVSIIAALSQNRIIGNKGEIPWHISEDFKRFKRLTWDHPIIMGRKTHESIGRILLNRPNIIITRDQNYQKDNAIVVHTLKDALQEAKRLDQQEIFIIGGAQIFAQAINQVDKLYLTIVEGNFPGETYFPDYSQFKRVLAKEKRKSENLEYTFLDLARE